MLRALCHNEYENRCTRHSRRLRGACSHAQTTRRGCDEVRLPEHLKGLDGFIIPGGESTTIGKLVVDFNLMEPLRTFGQRHAIWGTCAGAIFLSKDISRDQPLLGLMDIKVARNAFGRQVDSFEADLDIPELKQATGSKEPFHAIFIRAPIIEVSLCRCKSSLGSPRQKNCRRTTGTFSGYILSPRTDERSALPRILSFVRGLMNNTTDNCHPIAGRLTLPVDRKR